jgi:hypothetical protein
MNIPSGKSFNINISITENTTQDANFPVTTHTNIPTLATKSMLAE